MSVVPVVVTPHNRSLDGVRALAAFGVVATHVGFQTGQSQGSGPLAPFLARLDFGVTLFFLLSGYLLYRPFAAAAVHGGPPPPTVAFWWRRALRILPAYWLAVVVTLGLLSDRASSATDWVSYLLLIQTYDGHDTNDALTQLWTLAVEMAFYALLPVLAALVGTAALRRLNPLTRQWVLLGGLLATALIWQQLTRLVSAPATEALLWFPADLDWFAAGMLLAVVSVAPAGASPRLGRPLVSAAREPVTCFVIGGLAFWLSTLPLGGPLGLMPPTDWQWTLKHLLYLVAALFLLLPLTLGDGATIGRVLAVPGAVLLGELSYGVYLWHLPLLRFFARRGHFASFHGPFLILFVETAGAALAVAAVSWFVVERPLLRRFSRRTTSGPAPVAAASTSAARQRS